MSDCLQQGQDTSLAGEPPDGEFRIVPTVAVIVLNWNGWKDTIRCLASLLDHDYPRLSIVLVDNGSTDDSVARIKNWLSDCTQLNEVTVVDEGKTRTTTAAAAGGSWRALTLITNPHNLGFSAGNNIGLDYVMGAGMTCGSVLFLNNDCVVQPNCIQCLVEASSNGDAVAYAFQVDGAGVERFAIQKSSFPKLIYLLSPFVGWNHEYSRKEDCVEVDWVGGAALLMDMHVVKTLLQQDGYVWRPDYFLYCEDDELSFRLRKRGMRMLVPLRAVVEHRSHSLGSRRRLYYTIRNRFHLCRDHFGRIGCWAGIPVVGMITLLGAAKAMTKGSHDGARLRMSALLDGVAGRRGKKHTIHERGRTGK